jgi:hypothetical protein
MPPSQLGMSLACECATSQQLRTRRKPISRNSETAFETAHSDVSSLARKKFNRRLRLPARE